MSHSYTIAAWFCTAVGVALLVHGFAPVFDPITPVRADHGYPPPPTQPPPQPPPPQPPPSSQPTYEAGPEIELGDIVSQCVSQYPEPRDRSEIAIGEEVDFWIPFAQDPDNMVNPDGARTPVIDSVQIRWSVTGPGRLMPTSGLSTRLTADPGGDGGTITVTATADDSGFLGDDPPMKKAKAIAAKTPTSRTADVAENVDTFGTPPPPQNVVGALTAFDSQIVPDTVDFSKLMFRENMPALEIKWPDGTLTKIAAKIEPFSIRTNKLVTNFYTDAVSVGPNSKALLFDATTMKYVDFSFDFSVPLEYFDAMAGKWVAFMPKNNHPRQFEGANPQSAGRRKRRMGCLDGAMEIDSVSAKDCRVGADGTRLPSIDDPPR